MFGGTVKNLTSTNAFISTVIRIYVNSFVSQSCLLKFERNVSQYV